MTTKAPLRTRFLGLCACIACATAAPAWSATLVGYWNLNEGTGTTAADSSGSGNTGTLINSPAWVAGEAGNALNFANGGKAYVSVSGAGSLANLTQGVTVAAWIKPRSAGGGNSGRIIDKDNNSGGWFFAMNGTTMVRFAVDEFPTVQPSRVTTAAIALNKWQHVAATWDGSTTGASIHLYVNGVLADGTTTDGAGVAASDADTPFALGNRPEDMARGFDGALDEVHVYNGILSAADIAALAGTTPPPPPPPDTQAPTVPTGLVASNITASGATITWTASTDLPNPGGAGVGGYSVYRNGSATPVATVTTGTSFTDSGLTSATAYTYQVAAFDKASPANASALSTQLTLTTQSVSQSPWTGGDIGAVGATGSATISGGTYTIKGAGSDIYATADSFQFESQAFTGDGSITARVVSQTATDAWEKAGVMFRETVAAGSRFVLAAISSGNGAFTEARTSTGAFTVSIHGPAVKSPYWVRLVRAGNVLTGFISPDGQTWTSAGSYSVAMASAVRVGLAVTSHVQGTLTTAVFDNVTVSSGTGTGPPPSVSVAPTNTSLTVGAAQQFVATVSGGGTVTWTVDAVVGGNSAVGTISSSGLYTAGTTAGTHNIVAISAATGAKSASAVAAVTDLGGVYTYHNDISRDGANTHEYALTPGNVNTAHFGKLASCTVDGPIYTQPLWAANLTVNGARHNVVFVATQHDGLFAFDADAIPCTKLWSVNLIDANHGGLTGETPVPSTLIGVGDGDIQPEVGVTGTPVIDPSSAILYVVSKSINSGHTVYSQRLHAINITTGAEMAGSPVTIAGTYPGTASGGSTVSFDSHKEHQRAGLAFGNGTVYIAWAAHEDNAPWYGWVMGYQYNGTALIQTAVLNVSPNTQGAGIWMGGGAPALDSSGNLFLITGNGTFDATSTTAPNNDYGDSLLQLNPALRVLQSFTPSDELADQQNDKDFGSGGAAILADLPAGNTVTHALICGGKDHELYVLNRDLLGGFGDAAAVQPIDFGFSIFATGAFWNNHFYLAGLKGPLQAFSLNPSTVQLAKTSNSTHLYGFPGATPSVSSAATQNGIVWSMETATYCTGGVGRCGPAVLYAHDASNVATELWNSGLNASDAAGFAVKFSVPTVANGRVYVGSRGNNSGGAANSTSVPGELDIYGLKQ